MKTQCVLRGMWAVLAVEAFGGASAFGEGGPTALVPGVAPMDSQKVQDQDDMLKVAMIAIDFPDQDFVITKPKKSDLFGNPQMDPIKREEVPAFYRDFWHNPSAINHGQTINGYWMEQSRGRYGLRRLMRLGHTRWRTRCSFMAGMSMGRTTRRRMGRWRRGRWSRIVMRCGGRSRG